MSNYYNFSGFLGCQYGRSTTEEHSTQFIQETEWLPYSSCVQYVSLGDKHCSLHEAVGKQRHFFVSFYDPFGMWIIILFILTFNFSPT